MSTEIESAVGGDDFSELARERRESAAEQATIPPPQFVLSVQHTEAELYLEPTAIPMRYVDPETLIGLMRSNYGASLEAPDLGALIRATSLDEVKGMTELERLKAIWELPNATIEFRNGKLPTKYGFVPIVNITVDYERVYVSVEGITELAEAVAYEVLELLWRSAGVERKSTELGQFVRLVGFVTSTRVDFGPLMNEFLGKRFQEALDNSFVGKGRHAGANGSRSHRNEFKPPPNVMSTVTWTDLSL